jgi:hypothetical protein
MNFSKSIQDLEKVEDMRTVSALLCTDEKTRQYLWNLSIEYTLLINKLIQEFRTYALTKVAMSGVREQSVWRGLPK